MLRLASFAIAFAAGMILTRGASAASFVFDVIRTTPLDVAGGAVCPDPCYRVLVFAQDPTRSIPIQAVQLEIAVARATLVNLPVPPGSNGNAGGGNVTLDVDEEGTQLQRPWNLSTTTGASPNAGNYALIVDAGDIPFTVNSLKGERDAALACGPASLCQIQLDGLDRQSAIYLGRFNLSGASAETSFTVWGITGNGALVTGPPGLSGSLSPYHWQANYLQQLNGFTFGFSSHPQDPNYFNPSCLVGQRCGNTAPEPALMILVSLVLSGLGLIRRGPPRGR